MLGYETGTLDIPACCVGLPTLERHVWIVAARVGFGLQRRGAGAAQKRGSQASISGSYQGIGNRRDISESEFLRVDKRVSRKLDKFGARRIKALGNAIIPQIAFEIFKAIEQAEL